MESPKIRKKFLEEIYWKKSKMKYLEESLHRFLEGIA